MASAVAINRDELMEIGKHCEEPSCHQLDFLPFRCSCGRVFCGEHWRADQHACPNPPLQDNRIERPLCPLCGVAVTVERGVDPNVPMDAHFAVCPVLDPRTGLAASKPAPPKPANVCRASRCSTKLVAMKFSCAKCRRDYCVKHRDARDHGCPSLDPPAPPKASASGGGGIKAQPGRVSSSGLAALRRMRESAGPRASSSKPAVAKTGPGSSRAQPISLDDSDDEVTVVSSKKSSLKQAIGMTKEDRRARAERESAQKALERRAAKGLLNDREKVQLAELKAAEARLRMAADKPASDCQLS